MSSIHLQKRPRLHQAYDLHQNLMGKLDGDWSLDDLKNWIESVPDTINEFDEIKDIVEIYESEISQYLSLGDQMKNTYRFEVQGICDAIKEMPKCIFDVLRGRCFYSTTTDNDSDGGAVYRYGINSIRFKKNAIQISQRINEEKYQ